MTLTVRVKAKKVNGKPLQVAIPGKPGAFFENGKNIKLTDEQMKDPRVIRLLPRSYPGGRMGDLTIIKDDTKKTEGGS